MLVIISVASLSSGGLEVCVQRPQHHANAFRIYHSSEQIRATLLKFGISSRFSPSILPSAVRWQQRRANRSDARPLLAAFVPIQHGSPPTSENARTPCKTTKCLRHVSRGLNFGGVRRHFGLPLQSSNLIGDFRSVASIPQSLLPLPTPH